MILDKIQNLVDKCEYEDALSVIEKGLGKEPENIDLLFAKARLYKRMILNSKAVNTYLRILEIQPDLKKAQIEKDLLHMVMLQENNDKFESTNLYDDPWL